MDNNSFGSKLKELRIKSGLTQAQLADRLDISASTIGMYEQDRREPDNDTLIMLCNELNASVDYLLGLKESIRQSKKKVNDIISNYINFIKNNDNLRFNGIPINEKDKEEIISALRVASALSENSFGDENYENKSL